MWCDVYTYVGYVWIKVGKVILRCTFTISNAQNEE